MPKKKQHFVSSSIITRARLRAAVPMASPTAAGNRIDTLEAQLLAISGQLQTLITAAGGGAGGGDGGASGGVGGGGGGNIPATPQRRRLDTPSVKKLHGDVIIPLLWSWRNR